MMKSEHFVRELSLIVSEDLRMAVKSYLDEATPEYFWIIGASSSGKYHPIFAQGDGGLVRHTKAVVMFAEELLRMSSYAYMKEEYKDYVIAACIVHDTAKYGMGKEMVKEDYKFHATAAAIAFSNWCYNECGFELSEFCKNAISAHMGQWSSDRNDRPFTSIDRCVHMADYMASRPFLDIPQVSNEWNEVENQAFIDEEIDMDSLPFY